MSPADSGSPGASWSGDSSEGAVPEATALGSYSSSALQIGIALRAVASGTAPSEESPDQLALGDPLSAGLILQSKEWVSAVSDLPLDLQVRSSIEEQPELAKPSTKTRPRTNTSEWGGADCGECEESDADPLCTQGQ